MDTKIKLKATSGDLVETKEIMVSQDRKNWYFSTLFKKR